MIVLSDLLTFGEANEMKTENNEMDIRKLSYCKITI